MDVKRLRELDEWVQEQDALRRAGKPSSWDQNVWFEQEAPGTPRDVEYGEPGHPRWVTITVPHCGTVCCAAGHIAETSGEWTLRQLQTEVRINPDTGDTESVARYAERVLGLTYQQAQRLFDANNDAQTIHEIIEGIIEHWMLTAE